MTSTFYQTWKNKNHTSDRACRCGSWKNHWMNYSGKVWPLYCSTEGCYNRATLGGHIYQTGLYADRSEYIVPICQECNHRQDEFKLKPGTELVSANKSLTCER